LFDVFEIINNIENYILAYFPFISDMLVIIIKNIFQNLDVANDFIFITVDIILDLLSKQIELLNSMIIHSMPSISLLITSSNTQSIQLSDLDKKIISLVLISESVIQKDCLFFT
jgi:hypothetical protein